MKYFKKWESNFNIKIYYTKIIKLLYKNIFWIMEICWIIAIFRLDYFKVYIKSSFYFITYYYNPNSIIQIGQFLYDIYCVMLIW